MSVSGIQLIHGQAPLGLQQALAVYTPAQILAALREGGVDIRVVPQNTTSNAPQAVPSPPATVVVNTQYGQSNNRGRKAINRNKPRVIIPPPGRPTRPLNSFIAYRSYYSVIFVSLQQKDISGFITYFWQSDPFKAKWTILAKAYSIIRDHQGRNAAPLDKFLAINAPFVGIVPPSSYLALLGWEMTMNDNAEYTLSRRFTPDVASFDQDLLTTNQTVHDVIQHSYDKGYIPAHGGSFWVYFPNRPAQNIMAAALVQHSPLSARAFNPDLPPRISTATPAANANTVQPVANQNSAPTVGQNTKPAQPTITAGSSAATSQTPSPVQSPAVAGNSSVASQDANWVSGTVAAYESNATGPDSTSAQPEGSIGNSILTERNADTTQPTASANELTETVKAVGDNNDDELSEMEKQMLAGIMAELDEIDRKADEKKKREEELKSIPGHDIPKKFEAAGIPFPYIEHFSPKTAPNITLDPYEGEKFDQYNINDLINAEMFE